MKRNNFNILLLIVLSALSVYFAYQLKNIAPTILNSAILLCDKCLSALLPTVQKITLTLSLFSAISLTISLIKTFLFRSKIQQSLVAKPKSILFFEKKYNLDNKIIVFKDSRLMAFCLGIVTARIYLSTQLLKKMNRSEVEAIILHEKHHLVGNDNLLLLILNFIKTALFFLPVIGDFVHTVEIQKEISADQTVISTTRNKLNIISALKKCIESKPSYVYAQAFSESVTIEPRIHSLIGKRSNFLYFQLRSVLISLSVVLLLANITISRIEVHSQAENSTTVCLDKGSCQNTCR